MSRQIASALGAMVVCVQLASGCGGKGKEEEAPRPPAEAAVEPLDEATEQQLLGCIKTLGAIDGAAPERRLLLLAEGCPHACPRGLLAIAGADASRKLELLIEGCDFYCDDKAKANVEGAHPRTRLSLAVEACGRDYYELPKGQEAMMSFGWFAVQRIGRWLADSRRRGEASHAQLVAELDRAMARNRFPLGLPVLVPDAYELAEADNVDMVRSRAYVVVTADKITAAAMPEAVLTRDGARLAEDRGGLFPGTPVELTGLEAELVRLERLSAPSGVLDKVDVPPEEPDPDGDEAGGTGTKMSLEEGKMGKPDSERQTGRYRMETKSVDPALARKQAIDKARRAGIFGALTGTGRVPTVPPDAPVILSDAKLRAARLLDVVLALGDHGGFVGIGRDSGWLVRQSKGIGRAPARTADDSPRLLVFVTDKGVSLATNFAGVREFHKTGSDHDWKSVEGALRELAKSSFFADRALRGFTVAAEGTATVQELVVLVDIATSEGFVWFHAVPAGAARAWVETAATASVSVAGSADWSEAATVGVRIGNATAAGDLDKNIIRRYIRRKLPRIKSCYERKLLVEPRLAGTVVVDFKISPSGSVLEVVAAGVHDEVSACVGQVIKSIQFPKPKGGGSVKVRYPFKFRSTGG